MDKKLENINTTVSNLESKFNKLEGRVKKLENDQSTSRNTFREMEDGLQEFNTQVNEAKATGEKIKEHCESKCKELETNYCILKSTRDEKICVSTELRRKLKTKIHRTRHRISACSQDWKTPRRWKP